MKKLFKKNSDGTLEFPLINIIWIIIPTVLIALTALYFLWQAGFFLSESEKIIGTFERQRNGTYSYQKYIETYEILKDGNGVKTTISPDGYEAKEKFTWFITEKKTLVINGHVKYTWNTKSTVFFDENASTTKKYWYVSKEGLYFGENTTAKYDSYKRTTEMGK